MTGNAKKLVIYGNGSTAQTLHYYLSRDTSCHIAGFCVDRQVITSETLFNLPVVPFDEVTHHFPPDEHWMMIAVGYVRVNQLRAERFAQAQKLGYRMGSYISSLATVWSGFETGENLRIGDHTIISPFARIGHNVSIGAGCVIGHHAVIKDHCFLSSQVSIAGHVVIEPYCYIGTNATIRNNITISASCIIGAGAVILGDTQEKGIYMAPAAERLPLDSDQISPK